MVLIVRFESDDSTNWWILGRSSETDSSEMPWPRNCFRKKYSGPFLLFPPIKSKVSRFSNWFKSEMRSRSFTFCIPKSEASILSRSALSTISQTPIFLWCKKRFRWSIASAVFSNTKFKSKTSFRIGHNRPLRLP